jgi:hypothetical protein
MYEDNEIKVDIDDNNGDNELETLLDETIEEEDPATQPIEVIREEIVTTVNPDRETSSVSVSAPLVEEVTNTDSSDDENIYEQLKLHSIQISKLTEIVESLQSQIKQLQEIRSGGSRTTSARKKSIQTKKKAILKRGKTSKKK